METKIIIAGFGGQGILFLGKVIAQTAMLEGRSVTWFPSYGAEIRGGTANCTVVISDKMVGSPVVRNPDVLIVMNEASLDRFEERLKPGGLLIMNTSLIKKSHRRKDIDVIGIPANEAADHLGDARSANMVVFGALIAKTNIISQGSAFNALREIIPAHR